MVKLFNILKHVALFLGIWKISIGFLSALTPKSKQPDWFQSKKADFFFFISSLSQVSQKAEPKVDSV